MVDVTLPVKEHDQSIMVTEDAAQVETTDTQLGQVLGSKRVTEILRMAGVRVALAKSKPCQPPMFFGSVLSEAA